MPDVCLLVQEDVLENNFNVLRMFARIYGTSAAPAMLVSTTGEFHVGIKALIVFTFAVNVVHLNYGLIV